ncbi:DUF3800 domain-containing protein [Lacipirellula sp.]|uniref:DUF3800 domain-containing protein n=1 Tax=Lacipirellula sp. TaxID=2691419 RepID=UPI003D0C21BF
MQQAFLDESGYTGRDLLNKEQRFLVLSALFISEDDAKALKAQYFPSLQSPELKHQALARRSQNWSALLAVQRECLQTHRGISFVADKQYLCVLKFLDDCIEPSFCARGFDFYKDGFNHAMASVLCRTGPTIFGAQEFESLMRLYIRASATKESVDIDALCSHARTLRSNEHLGDLLTPVADNHPEFRREISSPNTSTNVASSLLFGLVSQLESRSGGEYTLTHDASPAMRKYHDAIVSMMHTDVADFRISDVASISFPLQLKQIVEADSKASTSLQLADLLAGGVHTASKSLFDAAAQSDYSTSVLELYSDDNFMFMFPSSDCTDIRDRFANTEAAQMIDFIGRVID